MLATTLKGQTMAINDIFKADLNFMMKETGSTVSYNGLDIYGVLFHDPTEALSIGSKQLSVTETALTIIITTGSLGTLKNKTNIVVDGKQYQIYKYIIQDDGLETKIWLSEVS